MASLFIDTLNGKKRERPPVWFMRQAGRALPSYLKLREKYPFMELMRDPELAADVTLLPVNELGVDAAILFSDILVIPEALGMELEFTDKGPRFLNPLKDFSAPAKKIVEDESKLSHIYKAIEVINSREKEIPLIGFCGGPLTVFCYMMQGLGTNHEFPDALKYLYSNKDEALEILEKITDLSIVYATKQIKSGVKAFQIFETWAGLVPFEFYNKYIMPMVDRISKAVKELGVPVIFFPRGVGASIGRVINNVNAVGVDWQASLQDVRNVSGSNIVLQGNLDPRLLLLGWDAVEEELNNLKEFGKIDYKWIFNLGHGVIPGTSDKLLAKIVDWVKTTDWQR